MLRIANLKKEIDEKDKDEIYNLLKKVWHDLRSISHSLINTNFHQVGFIESLEHLFHNIEKTGKYKTKLNVDDDVNIDLLDKSVDIILFRMIQEIINNTLKHAACDTIEITLKNVNNQLNIEIKDNGIGFDVDKVRESSEGVGINNIISRARLINATVSFNSVTNQGTTVNILLKAKAA